MIPKILIKLKLSLGESYVFLETNSIPFIRKNKRKKCTCLVKVCSGGEFLSVSEGPAHILLALYLDSTTELKIFKNFQTSSVQTFQPKILIYRRGNLVYYHCGCSCISIYRPLSDPYLLYLLFTFFLEKYLIFSH